MAEVAAPASAPAAAPAAPAARAPQEKISATSLGRIAMRGEHREEPEPEAEAEPAAEPEAEAETEAAPEETPEEATEGEEAPAADPLEEQIHGLSARDILAAIKEGKLPDALWDALKAELIDGEDREERPLKDFRAGAMMAKNYTRKAMALAEERKSHAAEKQALESEREELYGMVRSWKDPAKLKRAAKSMGLPLEQVAIMWAEEYDRRSKLPPEVLAEMDALEAREIAFEKEARELRAKERKLRELQQGGVQAETQKEADAYTGFIISHLPKAFAAVGIQTTPQTEAVILRKFQECLGVFWPEKTAPTKEIIQQAAQATAELLGLSGRPLAAPAPAQKSPAAAQAAALKAVAAPRKPLSGGASYDAGKASSPARKALSARGMMDALRKARSGR
jgi:hypothetical protein